MSCKLIWSIPNDDAETKLRIRPLREQWEARGPGLLSQLQTILPWLFIPSEVVVRLIKPVVGGAGRVLSPTEIEFEAVLANPHLMLPEVVRLAWLIAQTDPAISADPSNAVALIPTVVFAAQHVELARLDAVTLECALTHAAKGGWQKTSKPIDAAQLLAWWLRSFSPEDAAPAGVSKDDWQRAVATL